MRTRTCLLLILLAPAAFGAALAPGLPAGGPRTWYEQIGNGVKGAATATTRYVNDRLLDFFDIMELNIGVGAGAKAGVEYAIGRTTLGYVESTRLGFDGRQAGAWSEKNASFGIFPLSLAFLPFELTKGLGDVWEAIAVGGFEMGTIGIEIVERENFSTTTILYEKAHIAGPIHERRGDIASIGAELHLLVGVRARVKPLELVDFVVGFIGIDFDRALTHPNPHGDSRGTHHPWKPVQRR